MLSESLRQGVIRAAPAATEVRARSSLPVGQVGPEKHSAHARIARISCSARRVKMGEVRDAEQSSRRVAARCFNAHKCTLL